MTGLLLCTTDALSWNSPVGPVTLTITDTKTYFNRLHVIDIALPPGTPFPLETPSYVATAAEVEHAGGAAGFVASLIAAAERTAAWRDYATRAVKHSGVRPVHVPAPRPKPGRRRLKLDAPGR